METIEDDIAALERKIEELDAQTLKFSSDFVRDWMRSQKKRTDRTTAQKRKWSAREHLEGSGGKDRRTAIKIQNVNLYAQALGKPVKEALYGAQN